jgi:hypothetical protein
MTTIILRTARDCRDLAAARSWPRLFASGSSVNIDLPIEPALRVRLEGETNQLLASCGCTQSTLVLVCAAVLLPGAIWLAADGSLVGRHRWLASGAAIFVAATAAGLTKLLVLLNARSRLRHLMAEVERSVLSPRGAGR